MSSSSYWDLCSAVTIFVAAFDAMFANLASIGLTENRMNDFKAYQGMDIRPETEETKTEVGAEDFVIEFKDVCFSYRKGEKECLHDINLTIRKGDRIAIFGENGAGKTTFVKLLLGLSEEKLLDSISEFLHDRTALLISHRMANVHLCN